MSEPDAASAAPSGGDAVQAFVDRFVSQEERVTTETVDAVAEELRGFLGALMGKLKNDLADGTLDKLEGDLRAREAELLEQEARLVARQNEAKQQEKSIEARLAYVKKKEDELLYGVLSKTEEEMISEFAELNEKFDSVNENSFSVANEPANSQMNRFMKVYNHSLVELPSNRYLNASVIDLFKTKYIACQWPLTFENKMLNTVERFWEMIVEYEVKVIVALQQVAPPKYDHYWPDQPGSTVNYPKFSVTHTRTFPFPQFQAIDLLISAAGEAADSGAGSLRMSVRGTPSRPPAAGRQGRRRGKKPEAVIPESQQVKLLLVSNWPEQGVLNDPKVFPTLLETVNAFSCAGALSDVASPVVVHGACGIGRTGVFVAADMIQRNEWKMDKIMTSVLELRKQRYGMIESVAQYSMLHDVILEYITAKRKKEEAEAAAAAASAADS